MDKPIISQENKNTCIVCGSALYPNSTKCRSCTRLTRDKNKICVECGVRQAAPAYNRCNVCIHQKRKTKHKCIDCGGPVDHLSSRCRTCGFAYRKQQADQRKEQGLNRKYRCADCGAGVSFKVTYCRACKKKRKPEKVKITPRCIDCGMPTNDRHSVRCRSCHLETVKSQKPATYCIDCGAETKQQADRCRKCYGISLRNKPDDYHALASQHGILWVGALPDNTSAKTEWMCKQNHLFESCYSSIQGGRGCPHCLNMINSVRTSKPQRAIFDMIGGIQNLKVGRYSIDIALQLPLVKVAVEYDCFFWHGDKLDKDAIKTENLMKRGWKVLRIKARNMIPTFDEIQGAIFDLMAGANYREIIMDDWGKGNVKTWSAAGGKVEER